MYDHYSITDHPTMVYKFSIVGREDQNHKRTIKQSIYIRVNDPSLNKNIDKYCVPHIWGEVWFNMQKLTLK